MIDNLKLTDEQIAQYIQMVEREGARREKNFGSKDAIAFAMGASVLFFATGQQGQIPAAWIFLPMRNMSPFHGVKE